MAGFAAISLHQFNPLALFLDAIRDAIPALACAGESLFGGMWSREYQ